MRRSEHGFQPRGAEFFAARVQRFRKPVRVEDDDVPAGIRARDFRDRRVEDFRLGDAHGESAGIEKFDFGFSFLDEMVGDENGALVSAAGDGKRVALRIDEGAGDGDEHAALEGVHHRAVEHAQKVRGGDRVARAELETRSANRHQQRGGNSVPGNVGDDDGDAPAAQVENVVKISADFLRRAVNRGQVARLRLRNVLREQQLLNAPGESELAVEPDFVRFDGEKMPHPQRRGELLAQHLRQMKLRRRELTAVPRVGDGDDAGEPAFVKERRSEQRARPRRRAGQVVRHAVARRECVDDARALFSQKFGKNGRLHGIALSAEKRANDVRAARIFQFRRVAVEKREQPGGMHGNERFPARDENAGAHRARPADRRAHDAFVKHLARDFVPAGFAVERVGKRMDEIDGKPSRVAFVLKAGLEARELEFPPPPQIGDGGGETADELP